MNRPALKHARPGHDVQAVARRVHVGLKQCWPIDRQEVGVGVFSASSIVCQEEYKIISDRKESGNTEVDCERQKRSVTSRTRRCTSRSRSGCTTGPSGPGPPCTSSSVLCTYCMAGFMPREVELKGSYAYHLTLIHCHLIRSICSRGRWRAIPVSRYRAAYSRSSPLWSPDSPTTDKIY